jgi:anti-anti-sigma factor
MHQFDLSARADAPPPAFSCSSSYGGLDAAWVHVAGELDIATAPALERTLRESQTHARLVVLDLGELAFMDCAGMHTIVDASVRARQIGHRLVLVHGRPSIYRLFTLSASSADVEIPDLDPVQPPPESVQRSLVPRSVLTTA